MLHTYGEVRGAVTVAAIGGGTTDQEQGQEQPQGIMSHQKEMDVAAASEK